MKKQIVKDLKLIIEVNDLTYEEVAKEIGISYSTFASLISRDMYPRKENLQKVKDYITEHLKRSQLKKKYLPIKISIGFWNLTVEEAASQIGISTKCLQDIIDGETEPSKQALTIIEYWMGYTVAEVNRTKKECELAEKIDEELEQQKRARQARKKRIEG